LQGKADFATVARAKSEDINSLRGGGDIGFATEEDLKSNGFPPEVVSNLFGSMLIMFHQIAVLRRQQNPPDVYINPPIEGFLANDFFRMGEMIEAASKAKDELKRALEMRIERIS